MTVAAVLSALLGSLTCAAPSLSPALAWRAAPLRQHVPCLCTGGFRSWSPRLRPPRKRVSLLRRAHSSAGGAMAAAAAAGNTEDAELLFIYGSLMSEEVLRALLHRCPTVQPALLRGFHRFRIRGRPYPAIAPVPADFADGGAAPGGEVAGLVLCGLSEAERAILDYFEVHLPPRMCVVVWVGG